MDKNTRIYVSGSSGMAGSAIIRFLKEAGFTSLISYRSHDYDLRDPQATAKLFSREQPQIVIHAAGKVGGILANRDYPAEFAYDNMTMALNVVHESYKNKVGRLIFLGSSCIYPRACPQPIKEEYLLSGPLEPTNEAYALAKITGIKLCHAYNQQYGTTYMCLMPTNMYGPNDHYDLQSSHVLPALIRKIHEAKARKKNEVVLWGSGKVRREFMYVDDLAKACLHFVSMDEKQWGKIFSKNQTLFDIIFNVGVGHDLTIRELAEKICGVIGFKGKIVPDPTKPDGTPQKMLDVSKIKKIGFESKTDLQDGLQLTYQDFLIKYSNLQD